VLGAGQQALAPAPSRPWPQPPGAGGRAGGGGIPAAPLVVEDAMAWLPEGRLWAEPSCHLLLPPQTDLRVEAEHLRRFGANFAGVSAQVCGGVRGGGGGGTGARCNRSLMQWLPAPLCSPCA
jgi:hypothetical protein